MLDKNRFWRLAIGIAPIGLIGFSPAAAFAQSVSAWRTPEYRAGWQLDGVNAAKAYAQGYSGKGVTVGVFDSGLDTRHPEFEGRILDGYDFTYDRPITGKDNFDTDNHGTHVTGIIAAGKDGEGMHGVAFEANIVPAIINQAASNNDEVFADGWRFLADKGVSIINNSLGVNDCSEARVPPCNVTDYTAAEIKTKFADTIAAMKYTAQKDVLMVFSTGNEGQPAPDALGGMPYWVPELQDTFIAVGAIDSDGNLADFSNRCGVAAKWCLVAPGVDVYSTVPLGSGSASDPNYGLESGTSMAAPAVSGVAALVKEAFPFFTAHDLQQTLLTTAADMGDPEKYGWGLVNAGKAVLGYGRFVSDVVIDTKGYSATFANDIDGDGSLTKTGTGTLRLTGDNTYLGGTLINGGALAIDGKVASWVMVDTDGTLRGIGTIDAPLTVAGRLAPGNSPGTLTVNNSVDLFSTSTSSFDIDGTGTGTGKGNYSRLLTTGASGMITVDGKLEPVMRGISGSATNTYVASLGTRFDIIQSSTKVVGSFDALTQPGTGGLADSTRFDAIYGDKSVSLVVTPEAYGNLAANGIRTSANEAAVGSILDAIRPEAGPRTSGLFSGLYSAGAGGVKSALGELSGEIHAAASNLQITHANATQDAIGARIRSAFAIESPEDRATFWSSTYGGWGSADGGHVERFDFDMANVLFGIDTPVGNDTRIGLAGGFGRSNGNIDAQNASAGANHYDIVAYGSTVLGAFEASIGAAHIWSKVNVSRSVAFGGFSEKLSDSYDSSTSQLFGELGYKAEMEGIAFNPFVSAAYMGIRNSKFDETGGAAALSGTVGSRDLGVTVLGVRMSTDFAASAGKLSANAMFGWQHIYGNTQGSADVQFAAGTPFHIEGAGFARDAARIDLGLDYMFHSNAKIGVGYRGLLAGSSNFSSIRGDIKVAF